MSLELMSLKKLMNPNVILVDDYAEAETVINDNVPVIFQGGEDYLIGKRRDDEQKLTWFQATSILENVGLQEVIQVMKSRRLDLIVIVDKKKNVKGILDGYHATNEILHSYNYMKAYLETIVSTIDSSCTVIDENENVVIWTKEAENIFSHSQDEIVGQPITKFFDEEKLEMLQTLKEGKTLNRRQHRPREDLVVLINSAPIIYENKIIGAVASESDVTSQVRLNNELFHISKKMHHLEEEVVKLQPSHNPFYLIKGSSKILKKTLRQVEKIATTKTTVLILGESGVGKELFAKAVHDCREDKNAPFIPINCGAIPESLFESELFGYEKGAFSGANQKGKKGKVELSKGGTLFLDEIGEMPLDMQVKLLRVLQEKKYFPVGGTKEIEIDFHVVAASNKDLLDLVNKGKFREDLFYRLNVVSLNIPSLRERKEDVIELTHYFLYEFSIRYNRPLHGMSQEIMYKLMNYDWPGNIRELRNMIERLVVLSENGNIKVDDLSFLSSNQNHEDRNFNKTNLINQYDMNRSLQEQMEEYERELLKQALVEANDNKILCAQNLKISRATLYNRMNRLKLN